MFPFFLPGHGKKEIQKSSLSLPDDLRAFRKTRVLIWKGHSEVYLSTDFPFELRDASGRMLFQGQKMVKTSVKAVPQGIEWGSQLFQSPFISVRSKEHGIQLEKRTYKDTLILKKGQKEELLVINRLPLRDYLRGVIPFEANPKWSMESLKAQAIAARTYVLFRALESREKDFDVSSSVFSQVYVGKHIEHKRTDQAIAATEGEVLLYQREIFPAFYHSTSGGATTRADYVWPIKSHPALKGVHSPVSEGSPHARWKTVITSYEIEKILRTHQISLTEIYRMEMRKIDESGRARELEIYGREGKKKVDANEFRIWVGQDKLKSTLITSIARSREGEFVFKGRGWGHGVGMCQYGMKYLGELGYSHEEIIDYYYPGAQIVKLSDLTNQDIIN